MTSVIPRGRGFAQAVVDGTPPRSKRQEHTVASNRATQLTAGQCPVMRYNTSLMMAILWDRMPTLTTLLNTEVISLNQAPEACATSERIARLVRRQPPQMEMILE